MQLGRSPSAQVLRLWWRLPYGARLRDSRYSSKGADKQLELECRCLNRQKRRASLRACCDRWNTRSRCPNRHWLSLFHVEQCSLSEAARCSRDSNIYSSSTWRRRRWRRQRRDLRLCRRVRWSRRRHGASSLARGQGPRVLPSHWHQYFLRARRRFHARRDCAGAATESLIFHLSRAAQKLLYGNHLDKKDKSGTRDYSIMYM